MDEYNQKYWNIYALVCNQVRVSSMGDLIGLDYAAVLNTIKLYVEEDEVKEAFEFVLTAFNIEREFVK